jgi:hypothetical protein
MTDVEKVRTLIGDPAGASQKFTDDQIQFFLDTSSGSLFMASALACDSLASKVGATLKEVRIGDFLDSSGKNQVQVLQAQAEAFRNLEYNTPAFAIVEEDLSDFNALIIIRNYVLRTNP